MSMKILREKEHILTALSGFRRRDKFSYGVFQERGLNPSDDELCQWLQTQFNVCTDQLIASVEADLGEKKKVKILKNSLGNTDSAYFDTEERELICDYFYELSRIVDADIKHDLNSWLHGVILGTMLRISHLLKRPEKIVETLEQPCTSCSLPLRTSILGKEASIPDFSWSIIRCNNCDEYNLLSVGPGVKQFRFENHEAIEQLPKADYSEEQAMVRLEQIRYFRKR